MTDLKTIFSLSEFYYRGGFGILRKKLHRQNLVKDADSRKSKRYKTVALLAVVLASSHRHKGMFTEQKINSFHCAQVGWLKYLSSLIICGFLTLSVTFLFELQQMFSFAHLDFLDLHQSASVDLNI